MVRKRIVAAIVICIVIAVPITILGHSELNYGTYDQTPSFSVQVYSLKDLWFSDNPLFITGNLNSYYNRPYLMYPNAVEVEISIEDVTNATADFSWMSFSYFRFVFLSEGGFVNVTLDPLVNGTFGDGEDYDAGQSEWVYWPAYGMYLMASDEGPGISNYNYVSTGNQTENGFSIGKMWFEFRVDAAFRSFNWSLLSSLKIDLENAAQLEGHEIHISLVFTVTWAPVLLVKLSGVHTYSETITKGDGLSDHGVADYTFFLLDGYISTVYDLGL